MTEYITLLLRRKRDWRKFAVEQLGQLVECREKLTEVQREILFLKHLCLSADVPCSDTEPRSTSDDDEKCQLEQDLSGGYYDGIHTK